MTHSLKSVNPLRHGLVLCDNDTHVTVNHVLEVTTRLTRDFNGLGPSFLQAVQRRLNELLAMHPHNDRFILWQVSDNVHHGVELGRLAVFLVIDSPVLVERGDSQRHLSQTQVKFHRDRQCQRVVSQEC